MVKIRLLIPLRYIVTLFLAVGWLLAMSNCTVLRHTEKADPEALQIAQGRLGADVSLAQNNDSLVAIYSDRETTGIYEIEIPVSDHLPAAAPASRMIDRIDTGPPLASTFGQHALVADEGMITVMYLARAAEDKPVLKVASRDASSPAWSLDVLEPPGTPVAILPAGPRHLDLFWAAGALLHSVYPGSRPSDSIAELLTPTDRAGSFDAPQRGITVYDSISRTLSLFLWNGSSYDRTIVSAAHPIHSSLLLSDGRLAVLCWDASTRRLELVVQAPGSLGFTRTLVTVCEGTSSVELLRNVASKSRPAEAEVRAEGLLFLYDDVVHASGGRSVNELSMLVPVSKWAGRRYRKIVLTSGTEPLESFSAANVSGTLYVLVHQGDVRLLRWKLPG
jgi:hypothetical protein